MLPSVSWEIINICSRPQLRFNCQEFSYASKGYAVKNPRYIFCKNLKKIRLTSDVFLKDIINDRINIFINVFEQNREAILDGQLQLFQKVRIVESDDLCVCEREREIKMKVT